MLHLTFILLLIYNLFKSRNGKVKLQRSRLWQLDNSWRKVDVAAPSKVCFLLTYTFF